MHSMGEGGVSCGSSFTLRSLDAPLISFIRSAFPIPLQPMKRRAQRVSVVLHNKVWNTNYIMWFPYEGSPRSLKYRFTL